MDWRSVCRGIDGSCWVACGGIDDSCSVCAGVGGSRFGALCAINCFGAPLVGTRDFLGFRPLLFGMDPTPDPRNARSIMIRLSSSRQDGREGSGLSRASACGPHETASCSVGDSATLVRADRRLWVRRGGGVLLGAAGGTQRGGERPFAPWVPRGIGFRARVPSSLAPWGGPPRKPAPPCG